MCRASNHLLSGFFAALIFLAIAGPVGAQQPLTNATQVRALSRIDAAKKIPVRIRGVVVWKARDRFVVMDETASLYAEAVNGLGIKCQRGDLIEVEGFSDPGRFAPCLNARKLEKVAAVKIPAARKVTLDELLSGQLDAQWVEVSGVVRRAGFFRPKAGLDLEVATGGGRLLANLGTRKLALAVDSTVSVQGVCFYQFNKEHQGLKPILTIPSDEFVFVVKSAPTNLAAMPIVSIGSLMQFNVAEDYAHRVHVRGVVLHVQPGEGFWIRDAERALQVLCDREASLAAGTEVDVFGFVNHGEYGPLLEDATFVKTGKMELPNPVRLTQAAQALQHEANLVECEAVIQEQWLVLNGCRLKLSDGITEFPAVLQATPGVLAAKDWWPGSLVRVMGICSVNARNKRVSPGVIEPESFQLLLRSPADLKILRPPPWWTPLHLAWILGMVVGGLVLLVGLIVWYGRRRLREQLLEQMKSQTEFSAVWTERNRMARELHDTLAQGLGAISMQLDLATRILPPDSAAREPIAEARFQVQSNLAEARNSIWNMRAQVLENSDLASALREILGVMTKGEGIKAKLHVIGDSRRLAPMMENNLLRIGQEAITNAARHGQAKHIEVMLEFAERQFGLSISDDGRGFDPAHPPASEGGFGLVGMRERATQLNAAFSLTSAPGKGTIVKLTLPLSV